MGKQAIDGKRVTAFLVSVYDLTIHFRDDHDLYDERVSLPLDPGLVESVERFGVLKPILVRVNKSTGALEVIDGRQRARAALRVAEKTGKDVTVPVIQYKGDGETASIVANLHVADSPLARARKLARYLERGRTEQEAATAFGVTLRTIQNWSALLRAAPKVQKAVESGQLPATAAAKLSSLKKDEQERQLEEIVSTGRATVQEAAARTRDTKSGNGDAPRRPSVRLLKKVAGYAGDVELPLEFLRGVRFALGELHPSSVKGLTDVLREIES